MTGKVGSISDTAVEAQVDAAAFEARTRQEYAARDGLSAPMPGRPAAYTWPGPLLLPQRK